MCIRDRIKLELLAVPTFEGYKLPTDAANPWSVLPKETPRSLVWDAEGSRPELRLSNVEYGGRLSFALPGVDLSLIHILIIGMPFSARSVRSGHQSF